MTKRRWTKSRKRIAATFVVGLAGLVWGWMLWQLNLGQGLRLASYDLPFRFGEHTPPDDIVLVYLDESSHAQLGQSLSQPWDRRLHARLVERLTEMGARMIVFDILFHEENPEQDAAFAAAIRKHGNVILAGELVRNDTESTEQQSLLLATPELRRTAAGWGLTELPVDADGVVRQIQHQIPTDFGDKPGLAEMVRQRATGQAPRTAAGTELIAFYGRAGTFPGYSYAGTLEGLGIPGNPFHDKIVIVGARQNSGLSDAGKDVFPTPYTPLPVEEGKGKKVRRLTAGMEIQATAIANLLENRSIVTMPRDRERLVVVLAPFLLAGLACLLSPGRGFPLCILLGAGIALAGILLQQKIGFHFLWTIPAFGQMPLVAALSLGAHYLIEYSARWKLRRAFKSYMSDEQARQIDEDEVHLEPGGKEIEATILFSDLAGFTSMSEGLPPQALAKALIAYFESATEGILNNNGTIIKYIGDAVLATWGAPLKTDRKAGRAIDAAIQMQLASVTPVTLETENGNIEQVLETRVGINHGIVLAGNLGSSRRFDYTVVGDNVNIAARLEGMNKMLGTSILVTGAVLTKCTEAGQYLTRPMGHFVMKGKVIGIQVFEIFGRRDDPAGPVRTRSAEYLRLYQEGLNAFESGNLSLAADRFGKSLTLHDRFPEDPASRLFLDAITAAGSDLSGWRGEVILDSK
ncbi:adenylate/guanylate cyclase domain-containing protein [Luteolibacter arcticus]|uniref:Adenylate/guanylate cyclase domain-containing protein n=1 Tax=Luteolibacter arcticus TaxID=1581411 RepID=A0ABT3GLZ6_9BACT|nr:adenylate/guanylate cyclase domain-containing protein [Luteolibacter arcticus]MCW1924543.1 adenylate/guanylate cyclase domain-containing protein [Luteolibacter arcticus]